MARATTNADHPCESLASFRQTDWLGLVACVAAGLLVLVLAWFKLSSLDIGYHLAYGRHFLDTGRIVERDPFLYPETAVPFVNANWGSQVVMALAERAAGPAGLIALRLSLIACIFAGIRWTLRSCVNQRPNPATPPSPQYAIRNPQSAIGLWLALAWLLAALAGYERFSMRPELFSYAAMSVMLALLTRGSRPCRWNENPFSFLAGPALLQLAWVNLHSYFLVGPMLTGAYLLGEILTRLWQRLFSPTPAARKPASVDGPQRGDHPPAAHRVRLLLAALLLQIAVCFVNPWHYRGAVFFPLATLQFLHGEDVMGGAAGEASKSAWAEIAEFQSPFSFQGQLICGRTIHAYYVLIAVAAVGFVLLLARGRAGSALAVLILFTISTQMRRNIAPFAFVAAPLSFAAIADLCAGPFAALYAGRLRSMLRTVAAVAVLLLAGWWGYGIVEGRFYYAERRVMREFGAGYSDRTFPRKAVAWLAAQPCLKPNLYVDYFSSSNTLPWLPERFKLFVDTNTFAYRDETLQTAFRLGQGEIDPDRFFDEHGVNVVLLHCGPDTQMLVGRMAADDANWALVYFDRHNVVFVRRIVEHLPVIPSTPLTAASLDARQWITDLSGPTHRRALALGTIVNVPMSLGWWAPAAVLMEEATRLAPDYYEAWNYLGVCRGNLGNAAARDRRYDEAQRQWRAAVECFETVLKLAPNHAEAAKYLEATKQRLTLLREARTPSP
jgi:predicted aconitase with swiveling domain